MKLFVNHVRFARHASFVIQSRVSWPGCTYTDIITNLNCKNLHFAAYDEIRHFADINPPTLAY